MSGAEGDVTARIDAIESALDDLHDRIEACGQAMILSRAAVGLGVVALAAVTTIARGYASATVVLTAFTAIIGGIVWLGATKSTKEELEVQRGRIEAERSGLFDQIAARNGWASGETQTFH